MHLSVVKEDDVGEWIQSNLPALLLVAVGIALAVYLTIRTFGRRRFDEASRRARLQTRNG